MKKLITLLLAFISFGAQAQSWTNISSTIQRKIVGSDTTYRFPLYASYGQLPFDPTGGGGGVPTSRTISAGYGLLGGGDLTTNRVLYADSTVVRSWSNSLSLAQLQTKFNLYQKLVSLTTTGTSGAATFNPSTGALNIPVYTGGGGGGVSQVTSANADIGVANTTTTPLLTLNSGTGANQIAKRNAAGGIEFNGTGADLIESPSSSVMNYKSAYSHSFYTAGTAVLTINTTTTAIGSGSFSTSASSPVTHAILSTALTAPTTTGTTKMVITDVNGLLSFANIPGGTGASYSPTVSASSNIASASGATFYYTRVGDIVTVYGSVNLTATSPSTPSVIFVSPPVATSSTYFIGHGAGQYVNNFWIDSFGTTSISLNFTTGTTITGQTIQFSFTYTVI